MMTKSPLFPMLLILGLVGLVVMICFQGLVLAIGMIKWGVDRPVWILRSAPLISLTCWAEYLWIIRFYPIG